MDIETIAATAKFIVDNRDRLDTTSRPPTPARIARDLPALKSMMEQADTKEKARALYAAVRNKADETIKDKLVANHLAFRFFSVVGGGAGFIDRAVGR